MWSKICSFLSVLYEKEIIYFKDTHVHRVVKEHHGFITLILLFFFLIFFLCIVLITVYAFYRYVNLKACITQLPENGHGANVAQWPGRLREPPARLQDVQMDAYMAKKELFQAESGYWNEIVRGYVRVYHWQKLKLRNVMDMRAGFGG